MPLSAQENVFEIRVWPVQSASLKTFAFPATATTSSIATTMAAMFIFHRQSPFLHDQNLLLHHPGYNLLPKAADMFFPTFFEDVNELP
jgi:hypothetical protein